MYKILLADDEGIVTDSIRYIIERKTTIECQIEVAKNGRIAIETAQWFHPDVVFMDIQMPGLNGIEAMKEIRENNIDVVFIVLSAYDQFNYAQAAIDIGVMEYLTKPFSAEKITEILNKAILKIEEERKKISSTLEIKEKLKIVIPMLESGFVHCILFQDSSEELEEYLHLLEIDDKYGYSMVLEFGDNDKQGNITNPIGSSVRMYKVFDDLRRRLKEASGIISGSPLSNRIILFKSTEYRELDYSERIRIIESMRVFLQSIEQKYEMSFKIGIGEIHEITEIRKSYLEALEALKVKRSKIIHYADLPGGDRDRSRIPLEYEEKLYQDIEMGNAGLAKKNARLLYEWMLQSSEVDEDSIRMKTLELIFNCERISQLKTLHAFHFSEKSNISQAMVLDLETDLERWYLEKVYISAQKVFENNENQDSEIVAQAKRFIANNYNKNISLEEVSREINVSPYYFSKIFKEETGENYIDYLTGLRMEYAIRLIKENKYSIKEICAKTGYNNPNYFSRAFKKYTGSTPRKYREELMQ